MTSDHSPRCPDLLRRRHRHDRSRLDQGDGFDFRAWCSSRDRTSGSCSTARATRPASRSPGSAHRTATGSIRQRHRHRHRRRRGRHVRARAGTNSGRRDDPDFTRCTDRVDSRARPASPASSASPTSSARTATTSHLGDERRSSINFVSRTRARRPLFRKKTSSWAAAPIRKSRSPARRSTTS